ncbi:metal ABC transporter solute-binding protein, Zn/Mn family [Sunxiuqinia sp. A32]|uniref:metal ABC transporter solute-binding protein, Zn/Mn family n=1 Tax=Sunxiuqinia sp. A32 TaxID=3461496 RepID=UPI00404662E5
MRKLLAIVLIFTLACTSQKNGSKPILMVSIRPQKHFVEKIAGDSFHIEVIIPPGTSPATYSLLPSQMKQLAEAKAWLRIGRIGFEEAWHEKIEDGNPNLKVFNTSESADWIAALREEHGDHVHLGGIDPHLWMSPAEVKKIAEHTADALIELQPENKNVFLQNLTQFKKDIEQLDADLKSKFAGVENRTFLTFHPALTYLARDYGLEQMALEIQGKEPSPRYLSELVKQSREKNIHVVFIQKEFDRENAMQLARDIDGEVVQIDPLNEEWEEQLLTIADKIVEASK